ncbi:MAG: UDP-3-O-(3-hydroxymyristoyl)glucosamine N-acyltransferase, partial [Candidatus Eremiobacteraeota bacterium]|nr:UDP-3-O-(3-hydroxymyristoyl)glucosamine N-acyltransferase [Candidatus Eremiobacteraeota bacterium]
MTLGEYAARVGGEVVGDPSREIDGISSIDDVGPHSLTFATDERYLRAALATRAAAVLTEATVAERVGTARKPLLLVPSVRAALAALLAMLEPPRPRGPYRDPSAAVDPSAVVGPDVFIGPLVVVGA